MAADPVTASVHIDAPPERVYEYFTKPEAIVSWMGEYALLEAEPGGRFHLDIKGAPVRGRFLHLDPPRRLLISWGYAGSEDLPPDASTVEIRFTADRGGTRVDLEHRDLPPAERPRHASGWAHYTARLQAAAPGGDPGPDPGMPDGCPPRAPRSRGEEAELVTTPERDDSPAASYDPMRQFAELAGDVRDPYPMFAGIRAETPVLHVELGAGAGGGYRHDEKAPRIASLFTVTEYDLAQQVLTDNVRFSSAGYEMTMGQVMGRTILQMDPPEHQRHRALVAKAFRARVLDQWRDTIIGATVGELIDAFAGDGHADLIPQLTFPFPVRVIARVLGLPEADWPRFLRLSTQLIAVMRNWDRAVAASRELRGYFAEIIADRRRNPRDDLVSQLIEAEVDEHRLSDDEIYPFLLLLLPAGAETTYRSSSNLLFGLLSDPRQLDAVRADRDLVPQAIEEALRWETPLLTVARTATEEVELDGVRIPAGGFVAVSLGAANRDPKRYADPDTLDIFRHPAPHISFGDGAHKCLGMHLARMEMRVLLNAVLDRLPELRLDPAADDPHIHGMIFRSPPNLPVRFDPAPGQGSAGGGR